MKALHRGIGLALILLLAFVLLHVAAPRLQQEFHPDGDFAADMLLVNALHEDGFLLKGHYSRFGFNHPGPVFLYANALFEPVGALFGLPRANAWLLSALTVNLGFMLLLAWMLPRLFGRRFSVAALAAVIPLALLLGEQFLQFWMPYRLILPFAAFYLSVLLVLREGLRFLPLATALACVLIHGYVTMPLFTLPLLGLVTLLHLWPRRPLQRADYRWLGLAALLAALFAAPLLIDLAIAPQPNLLRILRASHAVSAQPHAGALESLRFTLSYWQLALPMLLPSLLVFLVLGLGQWRAQRRLVGQVAWTAAATTLVFLLYHITAPKPLYDFMGMYYLAIPAMLASLALYASLQSLATGPARTVAAVLAAAACLLALWQRPVAPLDPRLDIPTLGDALAQRYGTRFALDYSTHNQQLWGLVEGVLLYLKDRGVQACVTRPELDFMYTANATCAGPAQVLISDREDCDDCQYRDALFGFRDAPLSEAGKAQRFAACKLPHLPSTRSEGACDAVSETPGFVTFGPYVRLSPGRYRFELDYSAAGEGGIGGWDIAIEKGTRILGQGPLDGTSGRPAQVSGAFSLDAPAEAEIRTRLDLPVRIAVHALRLVRL